MDTFPSIEPVYAISKETNPLSKKAVLGDGYLKRTIFTLNSIKPQWSIQWLVSASDASTIDLFLKQHSEDGEWFYWTPPDGLSADKWRCDEWTIEHLADSLVRVNATFRQVFELVVPQLTPVEATCLENELCYDAYFEQGVDSNYDVWVARLAIEHGSYQYASNVFVTDNKFAFLVFIYPVDGEPLIHIAKFHPSGQMIWVNRYSGAQIKSTNVGNSPQLRITELTGTGTIAVLWEATSYNVAFGGGLWGTSSGRINGLLCVNMSNGSVKWGTKFFSNSGAWQTYSGPCSHHTGDNVPGGSTAYLSWNPYSKLLIAQVHYGKLMCFAADGTYPVTQDRYNSPYSESAAMPIAGVDYLGTELYDFIPMGEGVNIRAIFVPSLGNTALSSSGYMIYSTLPNSVNGARLALAGFLGNGQALAYFRGISGGKDEIMIIGANGSVVDHVRLPGSGYLRVQSGKSYGSWPYDGNYDGTSSTQWAGPHQYGQVRFDGVNVYINSPTSGINTVTLDVTVVNNKITQINAIKGTALLSTSPDYGSSTRSLLGAVRYSSSAQNSTRLIATAGKALSGLPAEVCLVGMKRTLNTNGVSVNLDTGAKVGLACGTYATFSGNQDVVAVTRTGLLGAMQSINNAFSFAGSIPINGPCPGPDIITIDATITAEDVTSSMPFDLYTAIYS